MKMAKRYDWLRLIFRAQPSEDVTKFVALPNEEVTDNLAEILERLQEAERKHSLFGIGSANR
jgi:hypothetical protein